ncbi:MAG: glycerol-3-phosphate 1-O-acyltransferase PlsY [Planctomycetota bacterium]
MTTWLICIAAAFLAGSIPFGVIIARSRGVDIRKEGSGNIGATNVGRVVGSTWGRLCFALDLLKGALPVLIAGIIQSTFGSKFLEMSTEDLWGWTVVMTAAVLGHMFSPWIGFKGGKGVATAFGGLLAMYNLVTMSAITALLVWYVVLRATKYVSLSSIAAAASLPATFALYSLSSKPDQVGEELMRAVSSPPFLILALLAALVIVRHRGNIARLMKGEEPKIQGMKRRGEIVSEPPEH